MKLLRLLTRLSPITYKSTPPNLAQKSWALNYSSSTTTSKLKNSTDTLYRRISPLGGSQTIVPVLDQWVQQGADVNRQQLNIIIKELRHYRRYKHALQVSQWMSDKRFMPMTAAHVAIQLDLIAKVHGVQEAENYFNNIPKKLRTLEAHGALLNCFSYAKCVDKAEGLMQKMRDLGFSSYTISYNVLLNLYSRTGDREKLDALVHELEAKQIKFDSHTYSILLNAYGWGSDFTMIEKILTKMESDSEVNIHWRTYAVAAKQFLRGGLTDKALQVLRKSEKLAAIANKKNEAYSYLLTLYANAGEQADVLRVWKKCKLCKATNTNYMSVLSWILKFNDTETAEMILKEWEDSDLLKDIHVPNIVIKFYCETGVMEKAEALIDRAKMKNWPQINSFTWSWMSYGYVKNNQMSKAIAAMESCLFDYHPSPNWKPNQEALVSCLKNLKENGDSERFNAVIGLLKDKFIISTKEHEKLIDYLHDKCAIEDVLEQEGSDGINDAGMHERFKLYLSKKVHCFGYKLGKYLDVTWNF